MHFAVIGAVLAGLSVVFGAFGAHALKSRVTSERIGTFQTGAQYEMYHALSLIFVGVLLKMGIGGQLMQTAGWLFLAGVVLFSGSLYLLCVTGQKKLGAITPLGGLCFIAGWVCFIIAIA